MSCEGKSLYIDVEPNAIITPMPNYYWLGPGAAHPGNNNADKIELITLGPLAMWQGAFFLSPYARNQTQLEPSL